MSCYHKIIELLVSLLDYVNMKDSAESCKDTGILGLQRRRIQSGARAWLLRAFM